MSKNQSNVTRKSHTIIVLLFALGTLELCWLPNVYFVHQNNLFIDREYHYCDTLQEPRTCTKTVALITLYSLQRLQQQSVGVMQSRWFVSRAVGPLFDLDQTDLAPTRCSQLLNFRMDLTVQFVWAKSTLLSTFWPINLLQDCVLHTL